VKGLNDGQVLRRDTGAIRAICFRSILVPVYRRFFARGDVFSLRIGTGPEML